MTSVTLFYFWNTFLGVEYKLKCHSKDFTEINVNEILTDLKLCEESTGMNLWTKCKFVFMSNKYNSIFEADCDIKNDFGLKYSEFTYFMYLANLQIEESRSKEIDLNEIKIKMIQQMGFTETIDEFWNKMLKMFDLNANTKVFKEFINNSNILKFNVKNQVEFYCDLEPDHFYFKIDSPERRKTFRTPIFHLYNGIICYYDGAYSFYNNLFKERNKNLSLNLIEKVFNTKISLDSSECDIFRYKNRNLSKYHVTDRFELKQMTNGEIELFNNNIYN